MSFKNTTKGGVTNIGVNTPQNIMNILKQEELKMKKKETNSNSFSLNSSRKGENNMIEFKGITVETYISRKPKNGQSKDVCFSCEIIKKL